MTEKENTEFLIWVFHKLGVMSFPPLPKAKRKKVPYLSIRLLISYSEKVPRWGIPLSDFGQLWQTLKINIWIPLNFTTTAKQFKNIVDTEAY